MEHEIKPFVGATAGAWQRRNDVPIGRIVSVTGAKAIVMLEGGHVGEDNRLREPKQRPEMGTLFAIDTTNTAVLAIVSALSVPVPAQREGERELWIAELGLVGELWKGADGRASLFQSRRVGLSRARRPGAHCFPSGAGARVLRRQEEFRAGRLHPSGSRRSPP